MKQLVLDKEPGRDGRVILTGSVFHYLARVRRVQEGHILQALAPGGTPGRLLITKIAAAVIEASWETVEAPASPDRPRILLYPALLKGGKLDDVLRQAVEAGIAEWQPWAARHSIAKPEPEKSRTRWEKIAREALQQSGRQEPVAVNPPLEYDAVKESWTKVPKLLVFHHLKMGDLSMHQALSATPDRIGLVFGPEGGLSIEETDFLTELGADFVWLGTGILRSETAVVFGLGAVQMILEERSSWKIL